MVRSLCAWVFVTLLAGTEGFRLTVNKHNPRSCLSFSLKSAQTYDVGIVGATGAVGEEIIGVLAKRNFPVGKLKLFASEKSAGKIIQTQLGEATLQAFDLESARQCAVVFLAVGGDFSEKYARELAADGGPLVIDNSSAFRYHDDVPLIVPEINAHTGRRKKLIANPNCTTAIALMALWPLHRAFKLKKVIMATYQAASGAGAPGMQELKDGISAGLNGAPVQNKVFAHPLPYNVIPHIDKFMDNGYTKEEMKVAWETRKILDVLESDLTVSCTAVRIPTLRAHSEAITIETELPITPVEARAVMSSMPGLQIIDDVASNSYPMPLTATNKYDVEVGRIRQSLVFGANGLDFFVVGDQLLRGAALNAVRIAEELL